MSAATSETCAICTGPADAYPPEVPRSERGDPDRDRLFLSCEMHRHSSCVGAGVNACVCVCHRPYWQAAVRAEEQVRQPGMEGVNVPWRVEREDSRSASFPFQETSRTVVKDATGAVVAQSYGATAGLIASAVNARAAASPSDAVTTDTLTGYELGLATGRAERDADVARLVGSVRTLSRLEASLDRRTNPEMYAHRISNAWADVNDALALFPAPVAVPASVEEEA